MGTTTFLYYRRASSMSYARAVGPAGYRSAVAGDHAVSSRRGPPCRGVGKPDLKRGVVWTRVMG